MFHLIEDQIHALNNKKLRPDHRPIIHDQTLFLFSELNNGTKRKRKKLCTLNQYTLLINQESEKDRLKTPLKIFEARLSLNLKFKFVSNQYCWNILGISQGV